VTSLSHGTRVRCVRVAATGFALLAVGAMGAGCAGQRQAAVTSTDARRHHDGVPRARSRQNHTTTVIATMPVPVSRKNCLPASAHAKNFPTCK
jgi:hypothetical protein